jgi:mannose-6-phosphate isomerase
MPDVESADTAMPRAMILRPALRRRAWGGVHLEACRPDAVREAGDGAFGESWELAGLDGRPASFGSDSAITAGWHAGGTVIEAIRRDPDAILGRSLADPRHRMPLLLKLLDAATPLSVQTHPRPAYAATNPDADVKHEGWFVLEATPGAVVYRGFRRHLARHEIDEAIAAGRLQDELVAEPVSKGDFVWLPSGTCHALGAGLLVAEVQTPSDTTYRVHDWGRSDANRPLHLAEAREAVEGTAASELPPIVRTDRIPPSIAVDGMRTWDLHRGERFSIERMDADAGTTLPLVTHGTAVAIMLLEGEISIETTSRPAPTLHAAAISTVLFPAKGLPERIRVIRDAKWLRIRLADRFERALA